MTSNISSIFNHPDYQTDQYHFLLQDTEQESFEETKKWLSELHPELSGKELEQITEEYLAMIVKIIK